MAQSELSLRAAICETCRSLWQRGLVGAIEGNVSCRLNDAEILATPRGFHKGTLRPADIVHLDLQGNSFDDRQPSSEIAVHLEAYRERPDCLAVVHAHPPTATGFALAHVTLPDGYVPEAMVVLGTVPLVPFGMPGTTELSDALRPFLAGHKTFLLANHGALTLGDDLFDAFARMETLERVCRNYLIAKMIGEPKQLPAAAMALLQEASPAERL